MSDNSIETISIGPWVIPIKSEEWAQMMNELSGRLHDVRRQHSDRMYELMNNTPRSKRLEVAEKENTRFEYDLRSIVSTWNSHERINFYVYNEQLREALDPIMEPWEVDYGLFCK